MVAQKTPITEGEQEHIASLCNDVILFQGVIDYCRRGVAKTEERIIALGRYRFFFLRRGLRGKLMRDHHLYDIDELQTIENQNKLIVRVKSTVPRDALAFEIVTETTLALKSLIHAIRSSYLKISVGFPDNVLFKLHVSRTCLLPIDPFPDPSAGGIIEVYRAQCEYYKTPCSRQVIHYLEDKILLLRSNQENGVDSDAPFELDLYECVGYVCDSQPETAPNYTALFAALRYNTHFRTLQIRKNTRREVLMLLFNTLKTNTCLSRLIIENDASGGSFVGIGEALYQNKDSALQVMQFSNNPVVMGEKGIINLSKGLEQLPRALTLLDISNCGITDKGLQNLIYSFEKNYGMSLALEHLNLSHNRFEEDGSVALSNWLMAMNGNSNLEVFKVADCGAINLMMIARGIRLITKLREWDISGNKISEGTTHLVCSVLEGSSTLTNLNVSGCSLTNETAHSILTAYLANKKVNNISIDLGKNTFNNWTPANKKPIELIPRGLSEHVGNLVDLSLSDLSLKDVHFTLVVQSLYSHPVLRRLNLSHAVELNAGGDRIASALSTLVWSAPSLTELILAGGFQPKVIALFLQGISHNASLQSLDLSSNLLKDNGAVSIAEFLRENKFLQELKLDNNQIGVSGWHSIASALRVNRSLLRFHRSFPWSDYDRLVVSSYIATSSANGSSLGVGAYVAAVTTGTAATNTAVNERCTQITLSSPIIEAFHRTIAQIHSTLQINTFLAAKQQTPSGPSSTSSSCTPSPSASVILTPSGSMTSPAPPSLAPTTKNSLALSGGALPNSPTQQHQNGQNANNNNNNLQVHGQIPYGSVSNPNILSPSLPKVQGQSQSLQQLSTLQSPSVASSLPQLSSQSLVSSHTLPNSSLVSSRSSSPSRAKAPAPPSLTNGTINPSSTSSTSSTSSSQNNNNTINAPTTASSVVSGTSNIGPVPSGPPSTSISIPKKPTVSQATLDSYSHMALSQSTLSTISALSTSPSRGVIPSVDVPPHLLTKSLSLSRIPIDDDDDDIIPLHEHHHHPAFPQIGSEGIFCSHVSSDDESGNNSDNECPPLHKNGVGQMISPQDATFVEERLTP